MQYSPSKGGSLTLYGHHTHCELMHDVTASYWHIEPVPVKVEKPAGLPNNCSCDPKNLTVGFLCMDTSQMQVLGQKIGNLWLHCNQSEDCILCLDWKKRLPIDAAYMYTKENWIYTHTHTRQLDYSGHSNLRYPWKYVVHLEQRLKRHLKDLEPDRMGDRHTH